MKKLLWIPLLSVALLSMAACGGDGGEPFAPGQSGASERPDEENGDKPDTPALGDSGRYLVLYASRTGNTERVAQRIQATLDCDMLEVEPQEPYDNDYNAMLERAQEELAAIRQGNFPPVKTSMENFDDYDIVFVGYPIWYGSMATPMQTFLHTHASKFAGKRIALFATSGSSGISASVSEARSLCPDAMEDNAAGRDFLSRLPLEVTLNDYNNTTEKIFYPDPALTTEGVTRGCTPTPGDITIYAPWGNVAIFCKNWSYSNDLIKIGRIDGDGIEVLNVGGDIRVKFERE